jgi:hypothetical protein
VQQQWCHEENPMKKRIVLAVLVAAFVLSFIGCELFWATAFPGKIVDGWDYVSGGPAAVNFMELIISADSTVSGYVKYNTGTAPDGGEGVYVLSGGWSNVDNKISFNVQSATNSDDCTWAISDGGDTLTVTGTLAGASCTLVFARWGT